MATDPSQPDVHPAPPANRWRPWKIGASLLVIFLGGMAVGAVLMLHVLRYEVARRADPARWTALLLHRIDRQVHLTPEQYRALEPLVRSGVDQARAVRARAATEIVGIAQRVRAEAAPTLSADQQQRLDTIIQARVAARRRWLSEHGGIPFATPAPP